jgi:hypothetical protein
LSALWIKNKNGKLKMLGNIFKEKALKITAETNSFNYKLLVKAWLIFFTAALFLIFQQYMGAFYGLFSSEIGHFLTVNNEQVSYLSGLFFCAFAVMQIPAGLILLLSKVKCNCLIKYNFYDE